MRTNITYVTALYNLKRDSLSQDFSRTMDHYFEAFQKLLNQNINLVVYCDEEVQKFIQNAKYNANTKIVCKQINFPFLDVTNEIRTKREWYSQAGWLEQSPQAKLEQYNPLVMSKQFMLNDTSIHNYFGSDYFFWIDAGITNTVNVGHYFNTPQFEYKLIQDVKQNKMLYVAFPYDGQNEVHGFKKEGMNRFAGEDTKYVCRGGFFGGTKEAINKVNEVYYRTLEDTLKQGYMGTEESVFTIISYRYPHYFNVQMINDNGLIGTYFDRVIERKERTDTELALYFLTFNAPEQIKIALERFKATFPKVFNGASKYLINNSTDAKMEPSYKKIIEEYNLKEHKFDNIGITGGRIHSARHFDKSEHKYMIFFEDDMIVNTPEDSNKLCKAGFKKYDDNLFEKSITILEENDLDYLKLSFSEHFGYNHDNWSWYNMDPASKDQYLKSEDCPETRTRVFYTGVHRGLAYSVGEYFYCNWPILFSKEGNRKFFIEECNEDRTPESILMASMQRLLRRKCLNAGILLASPITHKRSKNYGRGQRVENRL